MKRMFLSLLVITGVSLQAADKNLGNISESTVKPVVNVGKFPLWKKLAYVTVGLGLPVYVSYATAKTSYRFVGPLLAGLGYTYVHNTLIKFEKEQVGYRHNIFMSKAGAIGMSTLLALSQMGVQVVEREIADAQAGERRPSFRKALFHYFDLTR